MEHMHSEHCFAISTMYTDDDHLPSFARQYAIEKEITYRDAMR